MTQTGRSRQESEWFTPTDLPHEFVELDEPVRGGLGVGAVGKVGLLDLALASCRGKTRLWRQYQRAPLYIYRPIYLDARRPDMAFIFVLQAGDGLVQGDRYRVDIDCAPGAAAHITTQAATNVFAARQNFVTQAVNLRAGAGSVLEYLPDPVVPFRGSRLYQRTCVNADPESTVILGEILLPGRVAHDEAHVYDFYWSEIEVHEPNGSLLFADTLRLNPTGGHDPRSIGLLDTHDVVATLFIVTRLMDPMAMVAILREAVDAHSSVLAGVSALPNSGGAAVRLLGPTSKAVKATFRTAWNAIRLALLGIPAPNLRKG